MSYVGLDIAKLTFIACVKQHDKSVTHEFDNTIKGFDALQKWVTTVSLTAPHYCMEATGKYGIALADFLYRQQEKVSVVNPFSIKHFAKSLMLRNKTDNVDAILIAQFCQTHSPSLWSPTPENIQHLKRLMKPRKDATTR